MLVSDISSLRKRQQRTWIGALILRELLIESADTKAFYEKLAREFSYLNMSSSLLCLLERPVAVTWEKDSKADPSSRHRKTWIPRACSRKRMKICIVTRPCADPVC